MKSHITNRYLATSQLYKAK